MQQDKEQPTQSDDIEARDSWINSVLDEDEIVQNTSTIGLMEAGWKAGVQWARDNQKLVEPDIQKAGEDYSKPFRRTTTAFDNNNGLGFATEKSDMAKRGYIAGRTDERQLSGKMYSEKEVKSLVMSAISRYAGFIPESTRKGHEKSIQYWFEQNKKK